MPPPLASSAPPGDLVASRSPVGRRWPCRRAGRAGGDRAPRGTSVSSGRAGQADFAVGVEVVGRGLGPKAAKALFIFYPNHFLI
jgi:hypothetical protein